MSLDEQQKLRERLLDNVVKYFANMPFPGEAIKIAMRLENYILHGTDLSSEELKVLYATPPKE